MHKIKHMMCQMTLFVCRYIVMHPNEINIIATRFDYKSEDPANHQCNNAYHILVYNAMNEWYTTECITVLSRYACMNKLAYAYIIRHSMVAMTLTWWQDRWNVQWRPSIPWQARAIRLLGLEHLRKYLRPSCLFYSMLCYACVIYSVLQMFELDWRRCNR